MSSSFVAASSDFDSTSFGQTTSPPSLTSASSPASSDSTGDERQQSEAQKSGENGGPQLAAATSSRSISKGALSSREGGFSPSIWGEDAPSIFKGFQNTVNSADMFQEDKGSFDPMGFANWEGSFSSGLSLPHDEDISMDMDSVTGTDTAFSPLSAQSPDTIANIQQKAALNTNSMAAASSPSGSDVKTGIRTSYSNQSASAFGSEQNFGGSGDDSDHHAWIGKTSDNDEAMFESLIQAESFAPPSAKVSDDGAPSQQSGQQPATSDPRNPVANGIGQKPAGDGAAAGAAQRQLGAASVQKPAAGPSTTRTPATTATRKISGQTAVHSNNLDSDLGYSAFSVIRPPREQLKDLQVHVHGVPMQGAKSRVETQIRMRLELVQPKAPQNADGSRADAGWDRIGSFTHIKLPPLSGTKRKSKKYQRNDVPPEKTLFVDATVVNATPPHDRVYVCKGCRQRERKRAHRKKDPKAPVDLQPTPEEMKSLGIDPTAPDANERAAARMEEEEKKRVVLFNCGDFVDFDEGEAVLPTRITCYCRHHKEKVGFCVIFTMRDWQGRLVATGSTPPIMITDDHKSMGVAAQAAAAAAAAAAQQSQQSQQQPQGKHQTQGVVRQVNGGSPRASSIGDDARSPTAQGSASGTTTPNGDGSQRRRDRAKPYADSRRRRNASGKELSMTPYSGTGQNTPANGMSPPSANDVGSSDFWNTFAMSGSESGLGRSNSGSASVGASTPGGAASVQSMSPAPSGIAQNGGMPGLPQQQLHLQQMPHILQTHMDQGSLSPTSLQTNLQSLPPFDFEHFLRNAQMGMSSGADFAQFMAMAAAASVPPQQGRVPMQMQVPPVPSMQPNGTGISNAEQRPLPRISKLIPGEGPTSGGIEVTVLGENFVEGISCVFGDVAASNTKVWASNTLVCVLPPSPSPGPVLVSLKGAPEIVGTRAQNEGGPLQLFTYVDTTDRALMELALQVVGLQMTGQMRSAREVAMRVVGSGQQPTTGTQFSGSSEANHTTHAVDHSQSRDAVDGLFAAGVGRRENSNFQTTVIEFLSVLDAPLDASDLPDGVTPRTDAIRLANKQGHTLLHLAVMMGFHRLVEFLILRGCPVNARDANGATALHFAALLGRVTITRVLLRLGARDGISDANGLLPIDLAREKDQVDVEMILAQTDRTGHWAPTHATASHHDSGISISDNGVDSDDSDDDDDEDERDLDSDNLSTSIDDESEARASPGEDSAEDSTASDGEEASSDEQAIASLPTVDDEKAAQKAAEEKQATANIEDQLPVLKSWLSRAGDTVSGVDWVNKKLLPRPVAHRFPSLQMPAMPAIPVFHLALPAAPSMPLMPWSSRATDDAAPSEGSDRKDKGKAAVVGDGPEHWECEERGRLLRMWRSVVEESALWINPLYSPPPAYESVAEAPAEATTSDVLNDGAGPSRAASEASVEHGDEHAHAGSSAGALSGLDMQELQGSSSGSSTPRASKSSRQVGTSGSATPISRPKSSSGHRSLHSRAISSEAAGASAADDKAASSSASTGAAAGAASRRKRTLRDDAMLMWFWIPVLLAVVVVLLFSKSSSILSLADLLSYLDLPLDYYRPQVTVQAAREGVEAMAARLHEIGREAL